jgi:hypothetical protein
LSQYQQFAVLHHVAGNNGPKDDQDAKNRKHVTVVNDPRVLIVPRLDLLMIFSLARTAIA